MVNVLVYGGWFGSGNLGDDAILIGLKEILRRTMRDVEVTALSSNPEYTKRVCGIKAVQLRSPRGMLIGVDAGRGSHLGAFRHADLCLVSGGTPIYDYDHVSRSMNFGLPQILGKKLACFGVGVKPIRSGAGRRLTKLLVQQASPLSTRDRPSRLRLQSIGVGKPIDVTGDSALFMEPSSAEDGERLLAESGVDTSKPLAAFCPRALSSDYRVHYHEELTEERINGIRRSLARTADHLIEEGYELVSIPMHRAKPDDDLAETLEIRGRMRNRGLNAIERHLSPQEAMSILGRMELVVGLRLHSLILAAAQGVPIVSIDYDSKIGGFMELTGAEEFVSDIQSGPEALIAHAERALNEKGELHSRLIRSCEAMRRRIAEEARKVAAMVE